MSSDRAKFPEWNDKLSDALAQVSNSSPRARKYVNSEPEKFDGALREPDAGDRVRLSSGRPMDAECRTVPATVQ